MILIYSDSLLPSVIYILFELLGGRSSQPFDWLPFREWGKMSERTSEGGASRVRVTSSDDSRVDWIACAGSPSSSRLFLRMVRGVMDSSRDFDLLGESVP